MNAMMDKEGRARTLIHDVPESEILATLSEFGITKDNVPTTMGGSIDLDTWLPLWIGRRRAIEMEEI